MLRVTRGRKTSVIIDQSLSHTNSRLFSLVKEFHHSPGHFRKTVLFPSVLPRANRKKSPLAVLSPMLKHSWTFKREDALLGLIKCLTSCCRCEIMRRRPRTRETVCKCQLFLLLIRVPFIWCSSNIPLKAFIPSLTLPSLFPKDDIV